MTPEQIALVERTLPSGRVLDRVVADFYERLFAADPSLRQMFNMRPAVLRAKFAAELHEILLAINAHEKFLTRASALGARHASYGVRASHYATVGAALLAAMAHGLGAEWTGEVEHAWRMAYRLTAEVMMAGAMDSEDFRRPASTRE
jgi:hemoglobin-like flavoprotein